MTYRDKATIDPEPKDPLMKRFNAWVQELPDWICILASLIFAPVFIGSIITGAYWVQHHYSSKWSEPTPCMDELGVVDVRQEQHYWFKCHKDATLSTAGGLVLCTCPR